MPLQDAIKIGLENSEVIRVIALGAQGIPVSGFEPVPLNAGAGGALGTGTLSTVYDPAIQETRIANALAIFDAQFSMKADFAAQTYPTNNAFQAGIFSNAKNNFPFISQTTGIPATAGYQGGNPTLPFGGQSPTFGADISKKLATGAIVGVAHNIYWGFNNSPVNIFPSYWGSVTQLRFAQPLLGFSQGPASLNLGASGLEANRANIVVSRLNADISVWQFKSQVQALVRSVEQQYWVLAHQYVRLWAAETAFDLSQKLYEDVLAKQEVGSRQGSRRDLADAQLQVENARLQLVTATSDVLTTERQLRNILGLPPADSRRIIPVTEPTDARLEPNWEASLAQMVSFHPDIVQQQLLVRVAEMQLLLSRNQLLPALDFDVLYQFNGYGKNLDNAEAVGSGAMLKAFNPLLVTQQRAAGINPSPGAYSGFVSWNAGLTFTMPLGFRAAMSNVRAQQDALLRQRAFLQQTVHQQTHALARFFLEVDANYKQYRAAQRLKEAAWVRLDYNKARYEAGDRDPSRSPEAVTIQQYIDSINQWTNAVAQEAVYKSTYNTSIAVLEESKGTLLGYDNIAINEGPWPRKAYIQARDQQKAHWQQHVPPDGPYQPRPLTGPTTPDPVAPQPPSNINPNATRPGMPAPVGPFGPAPNSAPPQAPAGLPLNILSQGTKPAADPVVQPAAATTAPPVLPPLPGTDAKPQAPAAEAPTAPTDMPPISLPPLPPG